MADGLIQIKVDDDLARKAAEIYSRLGLDLSAAVQLFFNRSVEARGIPFSMRLSDNSRDKGKAAIEAMINMSRMAREAGIADMTLDEINAEIDAVRRGQHA